MEQVICSSPVFLVQGKKILSAAYNPLFDLGYETSCIDAFFPSDQSPVADHQMTSSQVGDLDLTAREWLAL